MLKRTAIILLVVITLGVALWGKDVCDDRSYRLMVDAPAKLYSLPPNEYPKSNPVTAILMPGHTIRVLRLRYGKDFQTFRVETPDGQTGWVIGGEGIKVLPHH